MQRKAENCIPRSCQKTEKIMEHENNNDTSRGLSPWNCCIATYIYKYMWNIIKHNDKLQWTNTLLYKNISLTLYSQKGWCWLCVSGELEMGTDCYILTQVLLTIAALLSHLGWVAQLWITEGPKLSVCRWFSLQHLVPNWLQLGWTASGTWLYNCLTSTCFRCSSTYLHRCISWLTAQSRVNMLPNDPKEFGKETEGTEDLKKNWDLPNYSTV